jgi:type I restriction enzyme S subunit
MLNAMKTNMQKYPAYKDSGVEWLGEIPKDWKSERLASILNNVAERNRTDLPLLSITRERGVILRDLDNEEENHNFIPDDLTNYKVLRKGQFGMNKMKAWQGSYGISAQDGIVSPAYFIFQLRDDLDSRYFHLAIRSRLYVSFFGSASDGVRIGQWDLSRDRMKNIPFLIPPIEEQTAIADFLDRKTALIDQAIEIKHKQIDLLKERRQILIHKAVTRGLNPDDKMMDSGVDWIVEIPVGWQVKYNRRLFREKSRKIENANELALSLSQVDGVIPSQDMKERSLSPSHRDNFKLCMPGDLIVNRFKGHLGVFFESQYRGIITFHYGVFVPEYGVNSKYFELLYHTDIYKTIYAGASNGMTIGLQNLSNQNFYDIKSIVPPIEEQKAIVGYSQEISAKVDSAIRCKELEIEKLKEYKATLINSAVTGKIKVC